MTQLSFLENKSESVSWSGNQTNARERLKAFLPRAGRAYASTRNYDFGPENRSNISCLSPYIRHRLLLEEDVVRETLARHSLSSAEKFIQEVFWRAYFKGFLEQRPGIWQAYRSNVQRLIEDLDHSTDLRDRHETAIDGKTGIDCFDAWASELIETGYLHNHARMWFASIWIFTLRLPWQLGADFFYRHLLDGDPASNTLSWRWVAGLHTKGKHYLARKSNIETYTDGRFSPVGLVGDALPLSEDVDYPQVPLRPRDTIPDDLSYGLIITEEDCSPETLPLPGAPKSILSLSASDARSPFETGALAENFSADVLEDAVRRCEIHFNLDARTDKARIPDARNDWGPTLVDFARELDLTTLVTAYTPQGPVRSKLEEAKPLLAEAGITLLTVMRDYDVLSWPHATRGFFKLKKKIPDLVRTLGLG
ncbi:MAG: FAD-binding domain-containing protein [Pseudomonadota bacterium]